MDVPFFTIGVEYATPRLILLAFRLKQNFLETEHTRISQLLAYYIKLD
jgi:hypothetical protein